MRKTTLSQTARTCQSKVCCLHETPQRSADAFGYHQISTRGLSPRQEKRHQQSHRVQTQRSIQVQGFQRQQKMVQGKPRQSEISRREIKRPEALQLERRFVTVEHLNSPTYGKPNMVRLNQSERWKVLGVRFTGAVGVSPHSLSCRVGGYPRDHKSRRCQELFTPLGFEKWDDGMRSMPL